MTQAVDDNSGIPLPPEPQEIIPTNDTKELDAEQKRLEKEWNKVNVDQVKEILINKHDFSVERVENTLENIKPEKFEQKGLGDYF